MEYPNSRPHADGATVKLDRLMQRWLARADSGALAELFDLTAPRLLRVAIHLVGDTLQAEDLVQAAFLALIEQRSRIAERTPAEAWLLAVIKDKATDLRRGRRSKPDELDFDVVVTSVESTDITVERRELQGNVAEAIDRLESPYREVLIARLRHGATASEIAHLLGRSPGQVRVQLHRGLEMLRAKLPAREALSAILLPLGLSPSLASGALSTLDSVRESVVNAALASSPTTTAASFATILLVMLKFAAGTMVTGLLALAAYTALGPGEGNLATSELLQMPSDGKPNSLAESAELVAPQTEVLRVAEGDAPASEGAVSITGQVIDAETDAPIAGVLVRCVRRSLPRQTWSDQDLMEEFPEFLRQQNDGSISPSGATNWPTQDDVNERRLARPLDPDNEVLAEAWTEKDGAYRVDVPTGAMERALLEFSGEGFLPRIRPVPSKGPEGAALQPVRLYRGYTVTGQLMTHDPGGIPDGMVVRGYSTEMPENPTVTPEGFVDKSEIGSIGVWTAVADEAGRFSIEVAGGTFYLGVLTPGWRGGTPKARGNYRPTGSAMGQPYDQTALRGRRDQRTHRAGVGAPVQPSGTSGVSVRTLLCERWDDRGRQPAVPRQRVPDGPSRLDGYRRLRAHSNR